MEKREVRPSLSRTLMFLLRRSQRRRSDGDKRIWARLRPPVRGPVYLIPDQSGDSFGATCQSGLTDGGCLVVRI